MNDPHAAERLQLRMSRIRNRLEDDVAGIRSSAHELTDWRYYLQRYPWGALGVVAAIGFLAVPSRRPPVEKRVFLDPETSKRLIRNHHHAPAEPPSPAQQGIIATGAAFLANLLIRAAIGYGTQQLRHVVADFGSRPRPRPSPVYEENP